jgi:hypothetical protein
MKKSRLKYSLQRILKSITIAISKILATYITNTINQK